jgi:predicted metal-dependent peptidase
MAESYSDAQLAEGKVRVAAQRLAAKHPFFARVLEQFKVVAVPGVRTMGVTVVGDELLLLHAPAFVLATPADQLGGVLLHEVHHVVLGHVTADPADFPDAWARTAAEEVTVNEFVREPLPGSPITLADFPGLPPLESTGQRYQRLAGAGRRQPINGPAPPPGAPGRRRQPQRGAQRTRQAAPAAAGDGGGPAEGVVGAQGARGRRLLTVDDHGAWRQPGQDPQRAKAAVRDAVRQAALEVGPAGIPPQVREAVEGLGAGTGPGRSREEVRGGRRGRLDWRRLLRRCVGRVLDVRPTFTRPPRRFPELVGVLPGRLRSAGRPKVMAVLDTSGSITAALLAEVSAELARLARRFAVTVVECDAVVQRAYRYRPLTAVCGRGGTDLRPPLQRDFLRRHRPDLVVYFTDGLGPAPSRPPGPPVVWCLTPGGRPPAPWGRVVHMEGA